MNIQRGFRDKVEKYADPNREISMAALSMTTAALA